jgi:hypothetical protein
MLRERDLPICALVRRADERAHARPVLGTKSLYAASAKLPPPLKIRQVSRSGETRAIALTVRTETRQPSGSTRSSG